MQKKANLYKEVYEFIKNSIVHGNFAPGEKLKEIKLAEMLNISRTPVREALRKLETEGLVEIYPSQGAQVANLNKKTMTNLYECRAVMEGLAAKKAALQISNNELDLLEESILLARQYQLRNDLKKVVEKNTMFHETVMKASQNASLIQMMEQVRAQILRYRMIMFNIGFRPRFLDEHLAIYHAIKNRKPDLAESLMKQHIIDDLGTIINSIENYIHSKEKSSVNVNK